MWPALRAVISGHATLGDVCGGADMVTIDDLQLLDIAHDAWLDAERRARQNARTR